MPQSKLSTSGNSSNRKLNTGRYEKVRNRVHAEPVLAVGLSAAENRTAGRGSESRTCRMLQRASARMLTLRKRCWKERERRDSLVLGVG